MGCINLMCNMCFKIRQIVNQISLQAKSRHTQTKMTDVNHLVRINNDETIEVFASAKRKMQIV